MVEQIETRKPGYWDIKEVRDALTRIGDSLEEAKKATTVEHITQAVAKAQICSCNKTSCQSGCPLGKEVPTIMEQLRKVDFDLIVREFAEVQKELGVYLQDYKDRTFEEFFADGRKGYIKAMNRIIESNPDLKRELAKLKVAYLLQVGATRNEGIAKSPFPEFTGMLCPAPCEDGGAEGVGCTLKLSGQREPVRIRSVENDLAEIGFALGWMDKIFTLPASLEKKNERVGIVGAGPAGLQLAYDLAMKGYDVTLMEKDDEIGGLLYRGIPDHKFEKWRLPKYRILLEQMGVKIELNKTVQFDSLTGFDAKIDATGVMNGQIRVEGYDTAKASGLVQDAYGFLRGGNDWAANDNRADHDAVPKGKQAILTYGDGYTATDVVQTLARMKIQNNQEITVIQAFRDTGVSSQVAGGFAVAAFGKDYRKHAYSTFEEDKKHAEVMTIPGANITAITTKGSEAEIAFKFQKPKPSHTNVSRDIRYGNYDDDNEVGGIYREGELVGLRLRDADQKLHDHAYLGDSKFNIEPEPSEKRIAGEVNGTLTLTVNRLIPALGAKAEKRDDVKNGVSLSQEGVFYAGDAAGEEQLIVSAQAHASRLAKAIDSYLGRKRNSEEIDLNKLANDAAPKRFGRAAA